MAIGQVTKDKMSSSSRIPRISEGKRHATPRYVQDNQSSSSSHPRDLPSKTTRPSRLVYTNSDPKALPGLGDDELSRNGFIRLNTHDVSFVEEHVPGIETFAADLQSAVDAAWPTRKMSRYEKAHVLMLSWEDDNLGVDREIDHLEYVFSSLYQFDVQRFMIPRKTSGKATTARILSFLENDGPGTLFIVYYAGHARLSHRSSEPPIWSATDKPDSPFLPSTGVQQLFEEAESDVLLLYDTCHSSHPAVGGGQGVTEVIAACGFETEAPAVGPHSFTSALIRELEEAFTGPPFSVAELHGRIIGSLKSWKPSLLRDSNGYVWTDENGQPRYECHKRRTPVHCFLTTVTPQRSIMLAPLPSRFSHSAVAQFDQSSSSELSTSKSPDLSRTTEASGHSTPPTTISDSSKTSRGPQVLLAVRLEDNYFRNDDQMSEDAKKLQIWCDWLRSAPDGIRDISIQGIYKSFSTLLLISIPVVVWDILPDNPAYSFVGFVRSNNLAHHLLADGQDVSAKGLSDSYVKSGIAPQEEEPRSTSTQELVINASNRENRDSGFSEMGGYEPPVMVTDAIGQRHQIPYHLCNTWVAFDKTLKATFSILGTTGKAIHQGHYQIMDEQQAIILPQTWEKLVYPGSSLRMHVWQGPILSKPPTPPPARGTSQSPPPLDRRPLANESLKRQRTLKRRAGFILPKPPLHENRPPGPEESSDERFEAEKKKALARGDSISSHSTRSHSPNRAPPEAQLSQKFRSKSSPPFRASRNSYPTEKARDTRRFETWSGFSKPSHQHISEKTRLTTYIIPARAKSLHEKVERLVPDPHAPRRSLSEASDKVIARAVAHRLRKEKGYLMLKNQYSGSTLRAPSVNSRAGSRKSSTVDSDAKDMMCREVLNFEDGYRERREPASCF